jgi:hypothetical protein
LPRSIEALPQLTRRVRPYDHSLVRPYCFRFGFHWLALSTTESHFFPLCAPIVVTLCFLSRGIHLKMKIVAGIFNMGIVFE